MNTKEPWYYSWPVVIAGFLIFWPIGIVILILKQINRRSTRADFYIGSTDKRMYTIVGIMLIIYGVVNIKESFLVTLLFVAGGGVLIGYADKITKRAVRNQKYVELIMNQGEKDLSKIANLCNIQPPVMMQELNRMITFGILKDARIDASMNKIILPNAGTQSVNNQNENMINSHDQTTILQQGARDLVVVSCPGCGAKVSIRKGTTVTCEYCDAPITS